MQDTVFLLGSDEPIARLIKVVLGQDNIRTLECDSAPQVIELVKGNASSVVLIDVGYKPDPALEIVRHIKADTPASIIAMSTSSGEGIARASIEAGADDYQPKPFDPDALLDRVQFLLGRPQPSPREDTTVGDARIRIDFRRRTLSVLGEPRILSRTEWEILSTLALNSGQPVFSSDIARAAFDPDLIRDGGYLDLWTTRLQAKIGDDPANPQTLRPFHNIAYVLAVGDVAPSPPTATGP